METMLRKHVLSNYASRQEFILNTNNINKNFNVLNNGPTTLTEQVETSDSDEFVMLGSTDITKSLETSDIDEFILQGVTVETRSVEISDPDSMYAGPTKHTYTIENTDEDEFISM